MRRRRTIVGFGLLFTAYSLFSAFLAWHLGGLARKNPHTIGVLAWSFFTAQVASLALSWMYFPPAPVAVSALAGPLPGLGRRAGQGGKGRGLAETGRHEETTAAPAVEEAQHGATFLLHFSRYLWRQECKHPCFIESLLFFCCFSR
jgi:hypothetical protein